jgi:hypothetical protein
MERMEQVPTGLKHILQTGKQKVNNITTKSRKGEFSSSQKKIGSDVLHCCSQFIQMMFLMA